MDLDQLNQILKLVREHDLSEFEIEHEGLRLKVRTHGVGQVVGGPAVAPVPAAVPSPPGVAASVTASLLSAMGAAGPVEPVEKDEEIELAVVKSPIVGTFYRSPEPGAPPFVDVGATIKKGQVLCVIEAMKLMNEIDAECDGEIVSVYAENGQPVQYGERLFAIRTT